MYGYIYETTNLVNNKKYIGMHKYNPNETKQYIGSGKLLRMAINKYGEENFITTIIETCDNREHLADAEKYWIEYYNAVDSDNYYNISSGGDGGNISAGYDEQRLNEYRSLLSSNMMGSNNPSSILSESDIYEIIELLLQNKHDDDIASIYGVCPSTINKIRYHKSWTNYTDGYIFPNLKSKRYEQQYKSVVQYDKNGNVIGTYKSMVDAEMITGVSQKSISSVCRGHNKTANGFVWRYLEDNFDKYDIHNGFGYLEQYDKNGNYICSFDTAKEACASLDTGDTMAAKTSKMSRSVPRGCNEFCECYGYLWKYNKQT